MIFFFDTIEILFHIVYQVEVSDAYVKNQVYAFFDHNLFFYKTSPVEIAQFKILLTETDNKNFEKT